jgi:hypothetical protein
MGGGGEDWRRLETVDGRVGLVVWLSRGICVQGAPSRQAHGWLVHRSQRPRPPKRPRWRERQHQPEGTRVRDTALAPADYSCVCEGGRRISGWPTAHAVWWIRKMGHDGSVLGGLRGEELKSEAW